MDATLRAEAQHVASVVGSPSCSRSCPFVEQFAPTEWHAQIFRAARLTKHGVSLETALAREPMPIDLAGIDAMDVATTRATAAQIEAMRRKNGGVK